MKFVVKKVDLQSALKNIGMTKVARILFIVDKERSKLSLVASSSGLDPGNIPDAYVEMLQYCPASVNDGGRFVIQYNYLQDIVRKSDDTITFSSLDDNSYAIKIETGNSEFKLNTFSGSNWLIPEFSSQGTSLNFSSDILKKIFEKTAYAASSNMSRHTLTGVNLKYHFGYLEATATDSYRMAKYTVAANLGNDFEMTVPQKGLAIIESAIMKDGENIKIASDNEHAIIVSNDNTFIKSRIISSSFPDVSRLIPTSFILAIKINRKELLAALERTLFIKTDRMTAVKFSFDGAGATLENRSQEVGSSHETLHVTYEEGAGEKFSISFNAEYLIDALKPMTSENVKLSFSGELKPALITDDDPLSLNVVMPVRTYN